MRQSLFLKGLFSVLICTSIICASMLSGCASNPKSGGSKDRAKTAQAMGRLPPQDLKLGECGLFVFTADEHKRFILFSKNADNAALWANQGEIVELTRSYAGGLSAYEQYPQQDFSGPDGLSLSLRLSGGEDIDTGMRFNKGRLRVTRADGWEMVMSVVAMASCQTQTV